MKVCSVEEQAKIISSFKDSITDRCELQDDILKITEDSLDRISHDIIYKFKCFSTKETAHNFLLLLFSFIQIRPTLIPLYGKLLIKISNFLAPLISPQELMILFSSYRLIVLNLFEANLIKIENIIQYHQTDKHYIYYFCKEIRENDPVLFGELVLKNEKLEDFVLEVSPEEHDKKRRIGMNDGKFETMIREGQAPNVHPNTLVSNSMYENSEFLTNITYAEYAAFFGCIESLKYYLAFINLKADNLLIYAIAGGKTETVKFLLEQKSIQFKVTHECIRTAINFQTTDDIEINIKIKENKDDDTNITLTRFYTLSDNKIANINSSQAKLAKYSSWSKSAYDSENYAITIKIKGKKLKNEVNTKGMKRYVNITDIFLSMKKLNWRYFIDNLLYVSDQINDVCDDENSTLLHFASFFGYKEVVKLLLSLYGDKNYYDHDYESDTDFNYRPSANNRQSFINVNALDKQKRTPLHLAVLNEKLEVIKILFRCDDTDFRLQDVKGKTVIHYLAEKKNRQILPLFFNYSPNHEIDMSIPDNKGNTAFHYFCKPRCFDPKILKFVCSSPRINPNHLNSKNVSELMYACMKKKRIDILEVLVSSDRVDVNFQTPGRKETALMMTAKNDNFKAAQILMNDLDRIDPNLQDYKLRTALHVCVNAVSPQVFRILVRSPKVNMNLRDDLDQNPVFSALYKHCFSFFEYMLIAYNLRTNANNPAYNDFNIDFTQRDTFSQNLLHYAIRSQYPVGVELMVKFYNINEPDAKGTTAFQQACALAYLDIIRYLVSILGTTSEDEFENTDINIINNSSANLSRSNSNNNINYNYQSYKIPDPEEIKLKVARYKPGEKIKINLKDSNGLTAFHYACQSESLETVSYLCKIPGIKINEKDNRGIFFNLFMKHLFFMLVNTVSLKLLSFY